MGFPVEVRDVNIVYYGKDGETNMASYKQIETSREIRLWIAQIIVPAGMILTASPEARAYVKDRYGKAKCKVTSLFKGKV